MFGLDTLDIIIGLTFVYLLLSLLATALNEYVATLLNLRGKELARGVGRLLEDLGADNAVKKALDGIGSKADAAAATLTERFYNHRLIRPLATRRGWVASWFALEQTPRLPSYIPARTFAMALLDVLGYKKGDAADPAPGNEKEKALVAVMEILKRDAPIDVSQIEGLLAKTGLAEKAQIELLQVLTGAQNKLQHLHDSVEVWFNNAMDRVSGAYKRTTQGWLFVLGLAIASALNADTIDMWHRLASNDDLRKAMAQRAALLVPQLESQVRRAARDGAGTADTTNALHLVTDSSGRDTAVGLTLGADTAGKDSARRDSMRRDSARKDSAAARQARIDSIRKDFEAAKSQVESMELKLGWTKADWAGFGWSKALGLLLTALAISLGAPFWFDLLNKVISIRAAGRSPEERPKAPEGGPKRAAEHTPK